VTKEQPSKPPVNENVTQIVSKKAGAPSKIDKREYFEISQEIISSLLKHETLTPGEIADACGYGDKGKNRISYVNRQIKDLVSKLNYIEQVSELTSEYRIKRDLDQIRKIYNNNKFSSIRIEFPLSPWLIQLLVKEHMHEFSADKKFIDDLKKMLETSSSMFYFFLRNNVQLNSDLNNTDLNIVNLEKILGPTIPGIKITGINMPVIETLTRKCIVYDLFVTCICLDHDLTLLSRDFPIETLQIFDEMKEKSAQNKLEAINYMLSFTRLQNIAWCADAILHNGGQAPPFFEEIVKEFNAFTKGKIPDQEDRQSLKMEIKDMAKLNNKIIKWLSSFSPINTDTGMILEMGQMSDNIMKKIIKGGEKKS
jgi:hypothetical protein